MEKRLARVERQCRWYRNLCVLAGVMVVALVTYGATKPIPRRIQARQFDVVNDNGKTTAILGAFTNNSGGVVLYGANGENGVKIMGRDDDNTGGLLLIYNKTSETVVSLEVDAYGNGVVGAYNRKGKGRTLKPGPQ